MADHGGRVGGYIQTAAGRKFWPADPRADEVHVGDVAHALANLCRFGGHTRRFYSVAQHSVLVSRRCDPPDALWGLLHDAPEAYLVDVPRPVKGLPGMGAYRDAEAVLMLTVCERFGLPLVMPESVRRADDEALVTEARDLMTFTADVWKPWSEGVTPWDARVDPWVPEMARDRFLARFVELGGGRD